MQRSALPAPANRRSDATDGTVASAPATDGPVPGPAGHEDSTADAPDTAAEGASESDTVVVHVQLRPRRGATRRCLAALAALATEHPAASFAVTGLSKDDRVVRITVGVELGPRLGVARFSPQAQAAYAFVSEIFTALYDHMPVYTAEPSCAERAAAAVLLESVAGGRPELGLHHALDSALDNALAIDTPAVAAEAEPVPPPRSAGWGERVSA
jgi:hypothetical protein